MVATSSRRRTGGTGRQGSWGSIVKPSSGHQEGLAVKITEQKAQADRIADQGRKRKWTRVNCHEHGEIQKFRREGALG